MNTPQQSSIEVELKFRVIDPTALANQLSELGAVLSQHESHRDLYFRHPCRDFVQTREALRIRRVIITRSQASGPLQAEHESRVTYKGPHLPGGIKARHELEWLLNPSDPEGKQLQELLILLGFEPVTTVVKTRDSMSLTREGREVTIALDEVERVGRYVEVEVLAADESDVPLARDLVCRVAAELNLTVPESRSYLSLLLSTH